MGEGARTKLRSMCDLLKSVSDTVDAQTSVEDYNVLVQDKKKMYAVYTITNSWYKTGGGATDGFLGVFTEAPRLSEFRA